MDIKFRKKESPAVEIGSLLLHSRTQMHIFHLQSKSYAGHIAIEGFYTDIVDSLDEFIETVQGKTEALLMDYTSYPFTNFESPEGVIKFLKELSTKLENYRLSLPKSWDNINNQVQVIQDSIERTIYKLKFLK